MDVHWKPLSYRPGRITDMSVKLLVADRWWSFRSSASFFLALNLRRTISYLRLELFLGYIQHNIALCLVDLEGASWIGFHLASIAD